MAVGRFSCVRCGLKCTTKAKHEEHMRSHKQPSRGTKEHACPECKEVFRTIVLLKKHKFTCPSSTNGELPEPKHKRRSRKSADGKASTDSQNSSNNDALKEQMFAKVHSLLDGSRSNAGIAVSPLKKKELAANNFLPLSADGIQSLSLSLRNSLDMNVGTEVTERSEETSKAAAPVAEGSENAAENSSARKTKDERGEFSGRQLRRSGLRKSFAEDVAGDSAGSSTEQGSAPVQRKSGNRKRKNWGEGQRQSKRNRHTDEVEATTARDEQMSEVDKEAPKAQTRNIRGARGSKREAASGAQASSAERAPGPEEHAFTCAHCSKVFSRKYHLDRHLKLNTCSGLPPPSYPCHLCNRVYTRKDNLREHLRKHTGENVRKKKHQCSYCNKAFHGISLLTIHERKHTGERPFACDFCTKTFPSSGALSKHRRIHTGEKPFACSECGYRFSLKGTLNRHMRVHTGIRPYQCPYCGKQFIQVGGLKAHLFHHTGENGFKCEDCGKVFNRKARLQMHKLYVHVKLRPFRCSSCPKSFTRKEDLARHAILHTGSKPFKCPTCSKSFAIKPSLKLHLLTHTKEEPRSCHECGRAFIRKDCLLRHMRKRHRDLLDKVLVGEKDGELTVSSRMLSEEDLCENIEELLRLLVEESTLESFGWPLKPVHEVLEAVIRRCGHEPVNPDQYSYMDRMRENAKLLFTGVIDDNAVKTLLNNQTVDEVILHVLRLAKA